MDTDQIQPAVSPQTPAGSKFKLNLARTSNAFVAEYSIFLIGLAIVLGCLMWLVSVLTGLMASGGSESFFPTSLVVLWVAILSIITLPVTAVLWSRTNGELTATYKGEMPRGGAHGFRSFWLVLSGLQAIITLAVAIYVPIAAAITNSGSVGHVLISTSLPAVIWTALTLLGMFIVTANPERRKHIRLCLWGVAVATVLLAGITYAWSSVAQGKTSEPTRKTPPIQAPVSDPYSSDPYYDMYNY